MSVEDYPEDIEIKQSNFKTDQQEAAAETIVEEWPVDLDTLAEEGQHVKMFYSQVLDQFLGPADAGMTFSEIQSEHGSVEQWAENGGSADDGDDGDDEPDVDVPDVDDIEPGVGESDTDSTGADDGSGSAEADGIGASGSADPSVNGGGSAPGGQPSMPSPDELGDLDADAVDERRRAWFSAGFREGVEFALNNPDLVADRTE